MTQSATATGTAGEIVVQTAWMISLVDGTSHLHFDEDTAFRCFFAHHGSKIQKVKARV